MSSLLTKIFGSKNQRELKKITPLVSTINEFEPTLQKLSDQDLRAQTAKLKTQLDQGATLDEILPEAFATMREASLRVLGMRHFEVQLIGGMVLHHGKIAEMKTGEGKTLCATLPIYLNALAGKGVHLVTVNDYLARRDAEWMGRIYSFLGLTTGVVVHGIDTEERKRAYASDITYGQNNEFGFDYLRDNMKLELAEKVQRPHNFAIVDEVDSILIDEARTPLIISGPGSSPTDTYQLADTIVRRLRDGEHYSIELKSKNVMLTDEGVAEVEKLLNVDNLYDPQNIEIVHHLTQSLKAHSSMQLDVDYVVRNGQIVIVDEFTGRLMPGRRWSDGLHQAIEAKEGVTIARENQTLATVTFQNYFRMYKKLAGMTGTADTEAVEFKKIYDLDVMVIPTNRSMVREDFPDVVYRSEKGKFKAVCDEIEDCYSRGQPVLVGTASIAKSELLSTFLTQRKIPHHVLNAKYHEREAEIVAQAGRHKAVTISTNMAGRGTDILLGGNPEFLAGAAAGTKDPNDEAFQEELSHFKAVCAEERELVIAAGGLHILGTERHESRRIDNQLRGRAGRQGDPGTSRFHIALDDDLMKRFGGERIQAIMARIGMQEDDAIAGKVVAHSIESAQKRVEGYHFDMRKYLLEYDNVLNKHREVVYSLRDKVLAASEIENDILEMIPDIIEETVLARASEKEPVRDWDVAGIIVELNRTFGLQESGEEFLAQKEEANNSLAQDIFDHFKKLAEEKYAERRKSFGAERMQKLQRIVFLQAIDYFWQEHLSNMDHLKEGVGLRGWGQKNPLHEYQREAYLMFGSMILNAKIAVLQGLFIPEIPTEEQLAELEEKEREREQRQEKTATTIHEEVSSEPATAEATKEGLNREQRRKAAQAHAPALSQRDYAPTSAPLSTQQRDRKDQSRKKAKEARKARKKAR